MTTKLCDPLSAIVGGREEGDELPLREELVAVLDDLVRAADEVHVVLLEEARDDVGPKGEADPPVVFGPAGDVLVRIGPEQVAQQACRRVRGEQNGEGEVGAMTDRCRGRRSAS